jgi:hypothetical protein
LTLALIGCSEAPLEREKPDDLISEAELIPVIIDLQLLESHYHRNYSRPDVYKTALDSASALVFDQYNISKFNFESSYDYYAYDASHMYFIYEAVLDTINLRISERQVDQP